MAATDEAQAGVAGTPPKTQDASPAPEETPAASAAQPAAGTAGQAEDRGEPFYYIADEPLIIAGDGGYARAHAPGDQVPAAHVHQYGWEAKVHDPRDDAPAPPAGPPSQQGGEPDRDALITTNGDSGHQAEPQDGDQ